MQKKWRELIHNLSSNPEGDIELFLRLLHADSE